ncbi:MAG: TerB family tellurite resistance protein [Chloroflexota bacterium]
MMRFLGLGQRTQSTDSSVDASETATVRRIVAELQQLDPERRRYLAGFAYVLSRAANADLTVTPDEARLMEQIVAQIGGVPEAQAVLVVEIAKNQSEMYGGTEDYLVTREFSAHASPEQRHSVVEACFAVAAADGAITSDETAELTQIATELDLSREELNEIRRNHADQLAAIKLMRGLGD